SNSDREKLFAIYLDEAEKVLSIERQNFIRYFDGFVLIRILQALGAYGYRGYFERKSHFLLSIPYALKNLSFLLENSKNLPDIPLLRELLVALIQSPIFPSLSKRNILTVTITSFSYKKGIPQDFSANGGGFVFDCRGIPNPGRYEKYKSLNGHHPEVIKFLKEETDIDEFLDYVYAIVDKTISNYIERQFTNLMVSFGCTGGQHRSVYCAEELARHLRDKFRIQIELNHTALENTSGPSEIHS
ncbi:MAG: phosphotransferase enzyme family protein, partial [Candidatus Marinimicrobia bacterium]|nr:phosphotransferase enzyme family protein [Candidatus Neomarinimicrobiota bacterium]